MRSHLLARPAGIVLAVLAMSVLAAPCHALPGDAAPTRLVIPSIGVDAAVEAVGLDAEGAMDVPSNWANVAWFNLGVAPGARGNAVMAGHLDTRTGAPAVFWSLGDLAVGDDVFVTGGAGQKLHYRVAEVQRYPTGSTPMDYVFGSAARSRLNLVTCTGTWNRNAQIYDHRLVVFSDLVGGGDEAGGPGTGESAAAPVQGATGPGGGVTGTAVGQAPSAATGTDLPIADAGTPSAAPTRSTAPNAGARAGRHPACMPSAVPCRPERL